MTRFLTAITLAASLALPAAADTLPGYHGLWFDAHLTGSVDLENESHPGAWGDFSINYTLPSGLTLFARPHIVFSKRGAITGDGAAYGCICKGAVIYDFNDHNSLRLGASLPLGKHGLFSGYVDVDPSGKNTQAVVQFDWQGSWGK